MNYPRIFAALRNARWAALPSTVQAVHDSLAAHLRGQRNISLIPEPPGPPVSPDHDDEDDSADDPMSVAVIEVHGIIGKNLSQLETMCGGVDVNSIEDAIDAGLADPAVSSILLHFDSPGGVVTGVPELAACIREADQVKPVYGFTDGQCCSAAYWLASQCRALACTVSADVGSIGVYMALCDDSAWWQKEGYKLELIKAGAHKAAGISGQPLHPADRALMQADVDAIYGMFTGDVRAGRGADMADQTMQGQTFMGANALAVGLVDEIVPGIDDMIADLHAEHGPAAAPGGLPGGGMG